jgi:neutral ceramidase
MTHLQFLAISSPFLILAFVNKNLSAQTTSYKGWKAGVARVVITPDQPLWMAGYANRDHPSEGKIVDLWAKALALQDSAGKQVVLVTADLVGIPKALSDCIRDELKRKFNLSRSQIVINTSHTHTGPVLTDALVDIYPLDSSQQQKIDNYTDKLGKKMVMLVDQALHTMQAVKLYAGNGVTRFQVNRRNNVELTLASQTHLNGPNDYAVPVIKVENMEGDLIAVAFGYACHNTVLAGYEWSGDYAGFAQLDLEKNHPGVTALFFQGSGGDQNPLPRKTVQLAKQYGDELAAATDRVLSEDMEQLSPHLTTAYSEVELSLNAPPTKEALLKKAAESSGYEKRWANHLLKKLGKGEVLRTSYPYPVEAWKLGDQPIFILGGEVVVEYAIQLKQIFGQNAIVLGYSNDVMSYIPTAKILQEGGYEGASSQMVYGLPNTWKSNIETVIVQQVLRVASEAGISTLSSKIN